MQSEGEHTAGSNIFIFNASNDVALATNSPHYTPTKTIHKLEADLGVIPLVFAKPGDIVLVETLPDAVYLDKMKQNGFQLPRFVEKRLFFQKKQYLNCQINKLKPWGWSLSVYNDLRELKPFTSGAFKESPHFEWNPALRELSGRSTASRLLSAIIDLRLPFCIDERGLPIKVTSFVDVDALLEERGKIVLKAPWSSSGRGVLMLEKGHFNAVNKAWVQGVINEQGYLMAETWYERLEDLSFLYSVTRAKVELLTISSFITAEKGQYLGSYIHKPVHSREYSGIVAELSSTRLLDIVAGLMQDMGFCDLYEGWIGVDAMIVRHGGRTLLHPCLEINCRYTMGHVAYALQGDIPAGGQAILRIGSISEYESSRNRGGEKGVTAITPVNNSTRFVGWVGLSH